MSGHGATQANPSRYADFEGSDPGDGADGMRIALPPRQRPRATTTQPTTASPAPVGQTVASVQAPEAVSGADDASKHVGVRPSVCQVPAYLLDSIAEACRVQGLSHAQLIIAAIEASHDRLGELVRPPATAGGSLFAARRGRVRRVDDGPLTQFSFRMSGEDFAVLDRLVAQFGATSRAQLITAALTHYLGAQTPAQNNTAGHPPDPDQT